MLFDASFLTTCHTFLYMYTTATKAATAITIISYRRDEGSKTTENDYYFLKK